MKRFCYRAALLGCASTLAGAHAAAAQAVENIDEERVDEARVDDEIVVTGLRKAIGDSIAAKRDSSSIIEAVSAEEIGKLPDFSIAESLARLPGLAAQRTNGRARSISIRGLGPDFTTTLLNGREQVTTGENRAAEFDAYPGELIGQAIVYKTPDAALIGQAISGTVDLRTIRPLDYSERTIAVNARGIINDQGALNAGTSNKGYRVSASIVDQFMDDTLGIAVGYARIDQPRQAERFNAWGYGGAPALGAASGGEAIVGGMKPFVQSETLVRDGYFGSLEYQPTDNFETSVDLFYTDYSEERLLRGIEFPLGFTAFGVTVDDVTAVEDDFVTAGVFGNVRGVVRNDLERREADLFAAGWNAKFNASERLTLNFDVGYSQVDREDTILETYTGTGSGEANGAADTLAFVSDNTGTRFTSNLLDYADPTLIGITAPLGWGGDRFDQTGAQVAQGGQTGFLNRPSIEEDLLQLRAWAEFELDGAINRLTAGVNHTDREKERFANEFFLDLANFETFVPVPADLLLEPTQLGFLGLGGQISYDPLELIARDDLILQTRNFNDDVLTKEWVVDEAITTGFVKFDVDGALGAIPVRGNFGVQVVHTDQESTGAEASGFAPNVTVQPITGGDSYTKFYPSMNLSLEFMPSQFVRLGVARVATRPRMDDMRASQNIGLNSSCAVTPSTTPDNIADCTPSDTNVNSYYSSSGGNPELRPTITTNFDVSYENYFSDGGYFSVAAFYKLFESYVPTVDVPLEIVDFAGIPPNGTDVPITTTGYRFGRENTSDGFIRGVEIAASIPFVDFNEALDGFGVLGSFSYTGSEVEIIPNFDIPVPGLSERVGSVTLFYEPSYSGFSARVSARHRSEFLGEVPGFGAIGQFVLVEGETIFDAQVAYAFDDGPLSGFSLIGQVENFTDEEFVTLQGPDDRFVRDFNRFGRTFLFGAAYRF